MVLEPCSFPSASTYRNPLYPLWNCMELPKRTDSKRSPMVFLLEFLQESCCHCWKASTLTRHERHVISLFESFPEPRYSLCLKEWDLQKRRADAQNCNQMMVLQSPILTNMIYLEAWLNSSCVHMSRVSGVCFPMFTLNWSRTGFHRTVLERAQKWSDEHVAKTWYMGLWHLVDNTAVEGPKSSAIWHCLDYLSTSFLSGTCSNPHA